MFLLFGSAVTPVVLSQEIKIDTASDPMGSTGYWVKWDSASDRLVLFRNIDIAAAPAARILSRDGRDVAVYPMKDLADARSVTTWAAAATPEGGLVLAIIAEYGPGGPKGTIAKSLLLTYDSRGQLAKVWDVDPYHHHQIAVDRKGNVFAFGNRRDTITAALSKYPLVVKYSPAGTVEAEFLPSDLFTLGDGIVDSGSAHGESQLFVHDEELLLWLAPSEEFLRFSLDGRLKSRVSLHAALATVAGAIGGSRTRVQYLGISQTEILAQVQVWRKADSSDVKVGMVKISQDGSTAKTLAPFSDGPVPGRFVGTTANGRAIFLDARLGTVREY